MSAGADGEKGDDAMAAEYALGVLPHAERRAFQARLEDSPDLRARVRFWEERLLPLADRVEEVLPPARVLAGIEARLFGGGRTREGWWTSLGFWRGLSLVSIAGLLMLGAVVAGLVRFPGDTRQVLVAELSGEAGAVRLVALYEPGAGRLRLNRAEGAAAEGRALELWLIAGDDAPVSLGLLPEDRDAVIEVSAAIAERLAGGVLAISDEPPGGSPTGAPTGAVLATGQVTAI